MSKTHNYPVFEHWYKTTDWIMQTSEKMPKNTRFSFSNRILNLALDNLDLITQAIYTKQKRHFLLKINMNLERLRIFMRLAKDRKYISIKQYEYIAIQINENGKMIGGWLKNENT
ncbi:MAG: diversity-generating retroelement protein Avd [Bacteroidales bacterium]|nr:diversity-generating retroelement protein Avd [Bacteroidales bacterium]